MGSSASEPGDPSWPRSCVKRLSRLSLTLLGALADGAGRAQEALVTHAPSLVLLSSLLLLPLASASGQAKSQEVSFKAKDGLSITADFYPGKNKSAPMMLLCHQARSSRGEYRPIAPRLQKLGFACLALDQRSGKEWSGVVNETAKRALAAKKPVGYLDARQDIEAGMSWIKAQGYTGKLVLWGSSYSASLVLIVAAAHPEVHAVLSFSPGEYFRPKDRVRSAAKTLANTPVLIVGPEKEKAQITAIHKVIPPSCLPQLAVDPLFLHGARTLYRGKAAKDVWKLKVSPFLKKHVIDRPRKKR
jgi:dienelactone hydrolase